MNGSVSEEQNPELMRKSTEVAIIWAGPPLTARGSKQSLILPQSRQQSKER